MLIHFWFMPLKNEGLYMDGVTLTVQEIAVPALRKVSATEQYFSMESIAAFSAFSFSIFPVNKNETEIDCHSEVILSFSLSPSIIMERSWISCRCFFNILTMSIALQLPK